MLGIVLLFYNSETFVVLHQRYLLNEFNIDRNTELLLPEVNDIPLDGGRVLRSDHQTEGDTAIFVFDNLIGGD